MGIQAILPKILGFLIIIVVAALGPAINTANTAIQTENNTNLTGMAAVDDFGAPIIILTLLFSGGVLAVGGVKGKFKETKLSDMYDVIAAVVVAIVGLTMFTSIMTYFNTLIDASTGFAATIYGAIPLVIYIGIIGSSGYSTVQAVREYRGNRSKKRTRRRSLSPAMNY